MLLLATNSALAERCALRIEAEMNESVQAATSLSRARVLFCSGRFRAIILDECLLQADPAATESLLESCRGACTIFVNMAISGIHRERGASPTGPSDPVRRTERRAAVRLKPIAM